MFLHFILTLTTLWANSADDKLVIFPLRTICMKRQNLFSGKNKKNISICLLLKILPSARLCVNAKHTLEHHMPYFT